MVPHKHTDGSYTRFDSLSGPLYTKALDKWLEVIIRVRYQKSVTQKRFYYDPIKTLWIDTVVESYSSNNDEALGGSNDDEVNDIGTG